MFSIPLVAVVALGIVFGTGLRRDPSVLPSALIGKAVPEFGLSPVKGRRLGLSAADLRREVSLVNVFASWCVACREEHPVLLELSRRNIVPIHGIDYKDAPDDAARWLDELGDPYERTGADIDGRVAIDWGVYGVPETYVIDRHGTIVFKLVGAVTPAVLDRTIMPLVARLRSGAANSAESAE